MEIGRKSSAFSRCEKCDGQGFFRAGDFADRTFPRCAAPPAGCGGSGARYLDPVTPRATVEPTKATLSAWR